MINLNPPAFPLAETPYAERQDGMSLRDYFAGQAMNGLLSNPILDFEKSWIEEIAFALADAMLAERMKEPKP